MSQTWVEQPLLQVTSLWILHVVDSQVPNPEFPWPWHLCLFNHYYSTLVFWWANSLPWWPKGWSIVLESDGNRSVVLASLPPRHGILCNVMSPSLSFLTWKMKIETLISCDLVDYITTKDCHAWHMINGGYYFIIIKPRSLLLVPFCYTNPLK